MNPSNPPSPPDGVQDLYDAVGRVVQKQGEGLRRLAHDAEGRLRAATLDAQHLERFLDELAYRTRASEEALTRAAEDERPALQTQLAAWRAQAARLADELTALRRAASRLEQLHTRIGWLLLQIEESAGRIAAESGPDADADPWALVMRAQLIQGQEAERSRLAREIHDGPAQVLTNTLLRLQLVESLIRERPAEAGAELARLRVAVREGLREVRHFLFNLRPASLQEVGLVGTLHRLIGEVHEMSGLQIGATLPASAALSHEGELAAFRVVQEALHNIIKHAGATNVQINMARRADGQWEITVADDGRGFTPAGGEGPGSGLAGMRERATLVGGTLDITSRPGYGSQITLVIPPADSPPA